MTPALADGTYTAIASQVDGAGNTGSSAPMTFKVDTAPPDTSIADGPPVSSTPTPTATPTPTRRRPPIRRTPRR